jgi:hypothetical protein
MNRAHHVLLNSKIFSLSLALAIALAFISSSGMVYAAGVTGAPEIFYQPAAGGMAVSIEAFSFTPPMQVSYTTAAVPLYTIESNMNGYGARFAYGLTERWATHIFAATESQTHKLTDQFGSVTRKAGGLHDLECKLTNLTPLGSWLLHITVGVNLSPDKRAEATNTKDGNINSGGSSIVNALGLSTQVGSANYWGLKVGYTTNLERTANANTPGAQDYKITGGNKTSVRTFFEADFAEFVVDLNLGYDFTDPVLKKYSTGSRVNDDAYQVMLLSGGMQWQFFSVYNARVEYESATIGARNYPTSGIQTASYAQSTLTFRLRFEF